MNTTSDSSSSPWSAIITLVGGLAVVLGAVDPMEGSLLILPGTGLLLLAARLGKDEHDVMTQRKQAFLLTLVGVSSLWGISFAGGFGGNTGRSMAWSLLLVPYLIGWSMAVWGRGAPRWVSWLGIANGTWYVFIAAQVLRAEGHRLGAKHSPVTALISVGGILLVFGLITITGCVHRLRKSSPRPQAVK